MYKRLFLFSFIFGLLIVLSCNNDDLDLPIISACDVENPIEDLEWLKTEVTKRKKDSSPDAVYCFIEQAMVDSQTIFIYNDCNPLIDKVIPVYDCNGNPVGLLGAENFSVNAITGRTIVFRPSNFECALD